MKNSKDPITSLYEKAADVLVSHFKTPSTFTKFIVDVLYSIRVHEPVPEPRENGLIDIGGTHSTIGIILQTVIEPWITGDKKSMGKAMSEIHRCGDSENYNNCMLRAFSAHLLYMTGFGTSRKHHNRDEANFAALFEVGFLLKEVEEITAEKEREQKEAA